MFAERHVKLFRSGRNQAVCIPCEFELDAQEAIMRQEEGGRLVIEPMPKQGLLATLAGLPSLADDFPDIDGDLPELNDVEL